MAYSRRNNSLDINRNRAWTADAIVDLASISARHGDFAYVTAVSQVYVYFDTLGWLNVSALAAVDVSGYVDGRIPYTDNGALVYAANGGPREVLTVDTGSGFPVWEDVPPVNGISFPATAVASADANTLDDYEEGTWTPVLAFGGASTGITYTRQLGTYTKVGNLVVVRVRIILSSKGSSTGNATITGLPFTTANDSIGSTGNISVGSMTGLGGFAVEAFVAHNATQITIYDNSVTGTVNMTDAKFTNTSDISITMSYNV